MENKNIFGSFIKFQNEFKGLKADGNNPFFKSTYITLDGILETVRPLLSKNNLGVIQNAFSDENGNMCVKTMLIHESGEYLETEVMKMKPVKDDPQQRGSCITYMKRYQLGALLGICESIDDDGNAATFNPGVAQRPIQKLTEKQINRLLSIAKSKGYELKQVKQLTLKKFNKANLEDLTREQYDEIVKGYESL